MQEIIKLRVPAADPDAKESRPEFVSHGNFDFELVPGSTIAIAARYERIATWLVSSHGLEEIGRESIDEEAGQSDQSDQDSSDEVDFAADYPEDFPGREALIAAEVPHATAVTLTAEQLVGYNGIGPKTADAIVAYVANNGGSE